MEIMKIFSDMEGEKLYSVLLTEEEMNFYQREFGIKSKALAVISPGSYQAKEAAKYGYDEDEYKKVRGKYALKGALTPLTATYIKKKAEKMSKKGKSKEEIQEYLENKGKHHSTGRVVAGVAEAVTPTGSFGRTVARGVGLYDKIAGNRAKNKKEKK